MADKTKFLISALTKEDFSEAEQLLQQGADPNHVLEEQAVSPMHIAAGLGLKFICLLIQYGGDPNVRIPDGTRPLHVSAVWGDADAVQILLANGADPFFRDEEGLSPLDLARHGGHLDVVHFLEHYVYILALSDEQTMTPKFTYKRLESIEDDSQQSLSPILYEDTGWEQDSVHRELQDFAGRRRSSVYLHSVQRQVDRLFAEDQKTHMLDVTSPDHPYIEPKCSQELYECAAENSPRLHGYHGDSPEKSFRLQLSVSDSDQSTSDSYVTCDGEDLESMLQRSKLVTSSSDSDLSDSTECPNTVVKRKFFPSLISDKSSNQTTDHPGPNYQTPMERAYGNMTPSAGRITSGTNILDHRDGNRRVASADRVTFDAKKSNIAYSRRKVTSADRIKSEKRESKTDGNGKFDVIGNTSIDLVPELKRDVDSSVRKGHGKYCERRPLFEKLSLQESGEVNKCKLCKVLINDTIESSICSPCKDLGDELEVLISQNDPKYGRKQLEDKNGPKKQAGNKCFKDVENHNRLQATNSCASNIIEGHVTLMGLQDKEKLKPPNVLNLDESIISLISYDGNPTETKCEKAEFHESDFSTITVPEDYDPLNDSFADWFGNYKKNQKADNKSSVGKRLTINRRPHTNGKIILPNETGDREVIMNKDSQRTPNHIKNNNNKPISDGKLSVDTPKLTSKIKSENRLSSGQKQVFNLANGYNKEISPSSVSPEMYDLWAEVRLSNQKERKQQQARTRQNVLDMAFCGRQSMNSVLSNASTVDYIYTDTENGIALKEHHIPSQCGSTGSRRSLDSLFSVGLYNQSQAEINLRDLSLSDTSQDTVMYEWREHAIIKGPSDQDEAIGATISSDVDDYELESPPEELLNLDNDTIRAKLCKLGDDPGPVTMTTRQAYLRRLSSIQKDPDKKLLTRKAPEYPPEMLLALNGNLDLSEMPDLENKMMSAFQNPNRLRRWREGTLKSSFTYILLDPRITRDLPNRAATMGDLDVFREFISAIFYIGKGKRARPYSHLYEAIKHKQKNKDKPSQKVQYILDIWGSGLGVVSLHCFQSVIPVEAYTREACMVDAIGLTHLTNMKRGDYYGLSTTLSMKQRRTLGVFLLTKSLQIFLAEGERQISPLDIKN